MKIPKIVKVAAVSIASASVIGAAPAQAGCRQNLASWFIACDPPPPAPQWECPSPRQPDGTCPGWREW